MLCCRGKLILGYTVEQLPEEFLGYLDMPERITLATASLLQTKEMRFFVHRCSQVAATSTIGNNSFHWMLLLTWSLDQ